MWRKKLLIILIACFCFGATGGSTSVNPSTFINPKNYWLAYTTKDSDGTGRIKLLKFNSAGIILNRSSFITWPKNSYRYPIAITDKPFPVLTIWSFDYSRDLLRKLVIEKTSYEFQSTKFIKRKSSFAFTNRRENNFMLYPDFYGSTLRAAAINDQGGFSGGNWMIYEKPDYRIAERVDCDVSEDGGAAVFQTGSRLQYMPLKEDGRPKVTKPSPISEGLPYAVEWSTVTDQLPNNSRLVAYEKYYGHGCNSGAYGYLMVRKLNSETGKPLGPEQFIRLMGSCESSMVRIDPKGKFILYHAYNYKKGKFRMSEPILFQFLDEEGITIGRPIPFAEGLDGSFDLVSE